VLSAKTRYRQADAPCTASFSADGALCLAFDQPQWAPTPGQSSVLYDGARCLGGGVITVAGELGAAMTSPAGATAALA